MTAGDFFAGPGAYDEVEFPEGDGGRPFVAITMVMTVDGAITPPTSSYPRVGGREDQQTYRRLRIHFDAVLRGAKTVGINLDRNLMNPLILAERRRRGREGPPLMAIVTNSGQVDPRGPLFGYSEYPVRPLVFTSEAATLPAGLEEAAEVVRLGKAEVDLAAVYAHLGNERGVRRIVCEGGPTLNHAVIGQGLADDYLLTVSPRMYGESRPRTPVEGREAYRADRLPDLRLLESRTMGGHVFLRYRLAGSPFMDIEEHE